MAKLHTYCVGYIILITTHCAIWGHPYANRNVQELENLKDLIQRLEDLTEENTVYPDEVEDVGASEDDKDNLIAGVRGQDDRINSPIRVSPESPVLSRLRDLLGLTRTVKSFSSCFGNRIERIGSWSGLGCNSLKTGTKKRIFDK